ncbi:MAG TPA: proprotein convertase P-domain-containing protein [Kofleriaceae bacterium]|nr:proprotein convertase P-domain-containing protein [Kofleriaceae bacterium]
MKSLLAGLGLTLVASLNIVGCADSGEETECLPGDIDCAQDSGDGKADGFNGPNDPSRFASQLQYKLSALPKKGKLETPVWKDKYPEAVGKAAVAWADTYWPTSDGSHNARWLGATVKSPVEKYDAAFNNAPGCDTQPPMYGTGAKAKWDTYNNCAGPAAKWQSSVFQGGGKMHDGIDNDGDGKIDDYGSDGIDGIQGWWGTCHAWTPAALMSPEPQHAVTMNGVTFEVGDIKALTQNIFDRTSAVMLGGRCNNKEINHDVNGSANDECADVNPGSLHVILTNFLGLRQAPLIEDRTANYEVWNQPVVAYEVTKQAKITNTAANTCVGSSGSTWKYNTAAKELYEVRVTVTYITETSAGRMPVGFMNSTSQDDYHYILELNAEGKILGGRYCTDSSNSHVDFLWSPTGSNSSSNPSVDVAKVKQLIKASVAPVGTGGGSTTTKEFSASPGSAIPDNAPAGVSVDVPVTGVTGAKSLAVSVDISHTYRGDLTLKLSKDGRAIKTLVADQGGGEDNIVETYNLTAAEIGTDVNGRWTLQVIDDAAQDTGKVNKVTLSFGL